MIKLEVSTALEDGEEMPYKINCKRCGKILMASTAPIPSYLKALDDTPCSDCVPTDQFIEGLDANK